MKKIFKYLLLPAVVGITVPGHLSAAQNEVATPGKVAEVKTKGTPFSELKDALYRGHNPKFHGFEIAGKKYLLPKANSQLDSASSNFKNFPAIVNFSLAQKQYLRADLKCAQAGQCEVYNVSADTQQVTGPVLITFNPADLNSASQVVGGVTAARARR